MYPFSNSLYATFDLAARQAVAILMHCLRPQGHVQLKTEQPANERRVSGSNPPAPTTDESNIISPAAEEGRSDSISPPHR